jgi:DNA-binding MarR family transcriptional regulator
VTTQLNDDMKARQKRGMFNMFQLFEALRELHPDMPLQMASIFMLIAMKPGINQQSLLGLLDISQSSMSRNVVGLTARNRRGGPGLNLIVQRTDPLDARSTNLYLTVTGEQFIERLLTISGCNRTLF